MKRTYLISAMILSAAATAFAQTSQPSGNDVTVVSVSGSAEKLSSAAGGETWQPLQQGETFGEQTILRTGFGAKVVLKFSDSSEVVINNATKVGVAQYRRGAGSGSTTRLGLKYGTMHASVDSSQGPADFQVSTPVATLSVRGTAGGIGFTGDFGLALSGDHGTWHVVAPGGSHNVGAGEATDGNLTPSTVLSALNLSTRLPDPLGGVDSNEKFFLLYGQQGRGLMGFMADGFGSPNLFPLFSNSHHQYEYDHGDDDYYYPPYNPPGGNTYPR
jgi:hypothetical protein